MGQSGGSGQTPKVRWPTEPIVATEVIEGIGWKVWGRSDDWQWTVSMGKLSGGGRTASKEAAFAARDQFVGDIRSIRGTCPGSYNRGLERPLPGTANEPSEPPSWGRRED